MSHRSNERATAAGPSKVHDHLAGINTARPAPGRKLDRIDSWTLTRSVRALEAAITEYLDVHNRDAKPFHWTATADAIFKKLEKLSARISDSGH